MRIGIVVLSMLLSGCISRREAIVVSPIHVAVDVVSPRQPAGENPIVAAIAKSVFGPKTAVGQMALGCGYFYQESGRWPRTREEVAAGLVGAGLSPSSLTYIEQLGLREDDGVFIIDFISTENGRVPGTITFNPERKMPTSQPATVFKQQG